jgi:excisionase family DNA binding protein
MMNTPSKFAFQDEGEALRRLGVDRDTLLALVRAGRLRAYRGFGTGSFFRTQDLDDLYVELYGERVEAQAAAEAEVGQASTRKVFDPAYKVHVRLQADLKWYDLEDEDLRAWAREMTADGYARQRGNIERVIEKLQRMIALMDERAATWKHLAPPSTLPAPPASGAPQRKARTPLPMAGAGGAMSPGPAAGAGSSAPEKKVRRPLPMAGDSPTPPLRRETSAPTSDAESEA